MRIKGILIITVVVMLTLTSCGKTHQDNTDTVVISRFYADNNSIRQEDESPFSRIDQENNTGNTDNSDNNYGYNSAEHIGELIINNKETSTVETSDNEQTEQTEEQTEEESEEQTTESEEQTEEESEEQTSNPDNITETEIPPEIELEHGGYLVVGEDIVYNNITFVGLNTSINDIVSEAPYDADTIIKFMLSTYKVNTDKVFTSGGLEEGVNEEGETDRVESLHEELVGQSENYDRLSRRYNDEAKWKLTLYTFGYKNVAQIAGCKSFVVVIGTDEDIEVDVSNFE